MCGLFLTGPVVAEAGAGAGALPSIENLPAPVLSSLSHIEADSESPLGCGEFSLYRWDRFPTILIFDTADFEAQNRLFSRLAFYLEKGGFRGQLLDDVQLEGKHGWNAHDYGAAGLAAFFNAASARGFRLDPEEILLKRIALREGILLPAGSLVSAGKGGVLSISRSSGLYERRLLLAHESYHGIFFASPEYEQFCETVWQAASPDERTFIRLLLWALGYDSSDHYLTVNEFQAYLLQQPSSMAAAYFRRVATLFRDGSGAPPVETVLPALLDSERRLESFLRTHFRIGAGAAEVAAAPGTVREATPVPTVAGGGGN
ncbi:MAG TPA: hypothetical protein VMC79_11820 [Rectinemataceae bacterium]|nr:hypothetical protein [Rectinemataceae bacterium]